MFHMGGLSILIIPQNMYVIEILHINDYRITLCVKYLIYD